MADVAFEARASTREGLFRAALDATMNVMVADLDAIERKEARHELLSAENENDLLHDFLQRALYHKDADQLLLRAAEITISTDGSGRLTLSAQLQGEKLDPTKHELVADVKAVTHHRFEVRREGSEWIATAVLDV